MRIFLRGFHCQQNCVDTQRLSAFYLSTQYPFSLTDQTQSSSERMANPVGFGRYFFGLSTTKMFPNQ